MTEKNIYEEGDFRYIASAPEKEETIVLLHGLLGQLSNFDGIINAFSDRYNVVVPVLPIYTMPLRKVGLKGLVNHVAKFIDYKGYDGFHILGNSLGGHLCSLYALEYQDKLKSMCLTGSSGLFENAMGTSFPKRNDYEWVKNKVGETFYSPTIATKELVDNVYETINDRNRALRIIASAKSAIRHNLEDRLGTLKIPALLIWGKNDTITPDFVGEKFHELIPDSKLVFIDECGHAPMMEHPGQFNDILDVFYKEIQ